MSHQTQPKVPSLTKQTCSPAMRNTCERLNGSKKNTCSLKCRSLNTTRMRMEIPGTGVTKSLILIPLESRLTTKRRESRWCHFANLPWRRLNPTLSQKSTLLVGGLPRVNLDLNNLLQPMGWGLQLPVSVGLPAPSARRFLPCQFPLLLPPILETVQARGPTAWTHLILRVQCRVEQL